MITIKPSKDYETFVINTMQRVKTLSFANLLFIVQMKKYSLIKLLNKLEREGMIKRNGEIITYTGYI